MLPGVWNELSEDLYNMAVVILTMITIFSMISHGATAILSVFRPMPLRNSNTNKDRVTLSIFGLVFGTIFLSRTTQKFSLKFDRPSEASVDLHLTETMQRWLVPRQEKLPRKLNVSQKIKCLYWGFVMDKEKKTIEVFF